MEERIHHAIGRHEASAEVEERHPTAQRWSIRLTGDAHHAAELLHGRLMPRLVFIRPGAAEDRHRTVDEPRIDALENVVTKPEGFHGAGAEILDEDICARYQSLQDLLRLWGLQVQGHVSLVAVHAEIPCCLSRDERWPGAGFVAPVRLLHLQHIGPHVPQQHGTVWAGEDP